MAGHPGLDLVEHSDGRTDLTRRTVAALIAVMLDEGRLHGMEIIRRAKALDRRDRVAFVHHGKAKTGVDADAINEDCARAALPVIASLLGAGQMEVLTKGVEQGGTGIEIKLLACPVDIEGDLHRLRRR